jgi:hypothetical protein
MGAALAENEAPSYPSQSASSAAKLLLSGALDFMDDANFEKMPRSFFPDGAAAPVFIDGGAGKEAEVFAEDA